MRLVNEQTISEMTQRLAQELKPNRIILFGSRAGGTALPTSDVDLFVIVPRNHETDLQRTLRAHRCLRDFDVPKDVVIRTQEDFDRYGSVIGSLEHHVLTHGRVLYG